LQPRSRARALPQYSVESMKNPSGKVLSLVDSTDGIRAIVGVEVVAVCPRCATGKGCGAGIFAAGSGERRIEASVRSGLDIAVGDVVEIALAPDNILRAAALVYGLPMLGAIVAAAIAYVLALGDAAAAMAALLGLGAGLAVGRWRLRQTNCLYRFVPSVERLC
jgi:sigma-E factor negative regulatory protein RseC